ncbi:MAG: LysE family translocator [Alphaproteobacteria bacterium]|nr:LysE family translocator [Alphaproteobacteria bacterium]
MFGHRTRTGALPVLDAATLTTFAVMAFALIITPGPDMLLLMTRSLAQGPAAGFATLMGVFLGCYFHALVAGLSLSGVLLLAPVTFEIVRIAGAAYLLWLALAAWRGSGGFHPPSPDAPRAALGTVFRQGLLTNIFNPKVALFFIALFPQFMIPDPQTALAQAMIFATVLNVVGLFVNGAIIFAAGRFGAFLARRPGFVRWQNRLLGGVFAGLALRLAFDRR